MERGVLEHSVDCVVGLHCSVCSSGIIHMIIHMCRNFHTKEEERQEEEGGREGWCVVI